MITFPSDPSFISSVLSEAELLANKSKAGGKSTRGPSRLALPNQCEWRWAFAVQSQIDTAAENKKALHGTLMHLGLAYYYAGLMDEDTRRIKAPWYYEKEMEAAVEERGEGFPKEIQLSLDFLEYYKLKMAAEPFNPLAIEEEFTVKIGELDPEGQDEDAIDYTNPETGKSFQAPNLNSEVVTCRSDLVGEVNGLIYIRDHKSKDGEWWGAGGRDRLSTWKWDNEFSMSWQGMVNLHIVRHNLGVDKVAGFQINRIKREPPFDQDCHTLRIPDMMYKEIPRVMRQAVKKERELALKLAKGEKLLPAPWECYHGWPCNYLPLCKAPNKSEMSAVLSSQYRGSLKVIL